MSRLVESGDECERPQSAPPQFADAISSGFPQVHAPCRFTALTAAHLCSGLSPATASHIQAERFL